MVWLPSLSGVACSVGEYPGATLLTTPSTNRPSTEEIAGAPISVTATRLADW